MNILIIGNGFDLAHGLPTKYIDFLKWVKIYQKFDSFIFGRALTRYKNKSEPIFKYFYKLFYENVDEDIRNEIRHLIKKNIWMEYFLQCNMYQKENWIDFEKEIGRVIKSLDNDMKKEDASESTIVREISVPFFAEYFLEDLSSREQEREIEGLKQCENMSVDEQSEFMEEYRKQHPIRPLKAEIRYKDLIMRLQTDLNKLICALEIYLTDFLDKIEITKYSKDITKLDIDYVLSFNYTDTYQKLYEKECKDINVEFDYIHGKADINSTIETNNMVLGIDENLPEDRKSKDIDFIAFKKYYQRIHKQTGCKYKDLVDQIREEWDNETEESRAEIRKCISRGKIENSKIHRLYIFGHSLDVTDKDVFRDLILNDNVYTTIFYYNKDVMGQQIANLVKVIGQDELINRTGGSTKTISFEAQQDMMPI